MSKLSYTAPSRLEFKISDEDEGVISGYAATWDLDQGGDRFLPGAFKSVIENQYPAGRVKVYREHNVAVGVPEAMLEDSTGLFVKARIVPGDSRDGDETLNLARSGVYDSFSVAYVVDPSTVTFSTDGGRKVRSIGTVTRLPHFGVLDDPMNLKASITDVKDNGADVETKCLYDLARVVSMYNDIRWIMEYASLSEEEAQLVRSIVDQMRQMGEAFEARLEAEEALRDDSGAEAFLDAFKSFKSQQDNLNASAKFSRAFLDFRSAIS